MDNKFSTERLQRHLMYRAADYEESWAALLDLVDTQIPIDPIYKSPPSAKPEPVWDSQFGAPVLISAMTPKQRHNAARAYEDEQQWYLDLGRWLRRNARAYHILLEKGRD